MCVLGGPDWGSRALDEIWSLSRERANTSPRGIRGSPTVPLSRRWLCQPRPLCRQALKAQEDAHSYPRDVSSRCVITLQVRAPPPRFSCQVGTPPCLEASFLSHCSQLWGMKESLRGLALPLLGLLFSGWNSHTCPYIVHCLPLSFFFFLIFLIYSSEKIMVFSHYFWNLFILKVNVPSRFSYLRGPVSPFLVWAFKTDRHHRMRDQRKKKTEFLIEPLYVCADLFLLERKTLGE